MNIILSHLSFPISGTDLKDKKVVPKWYMGPKGDNKRVYPYLSTFWNKRNRKKYITHGEAVRPDPMAWLCYI